MDNLDIERAMKLLEEAVKNKKPEKPKEKIIILRDLSLGKIPLIIPAHNSARVFEIEFIWLRPQSLKDALHIKEARRQIMYA